jgi:hypothetical protein
MHATYTFKILSIWRDIFRVNKFYFMLGDPIFN